MGFLLLFLLFPGQMVFLGALLLFVGLLGWIYLVVAPIVAIVYEAMVDGTWERLKACPADDCHWAFYDHSKNRSGTWCTMDVCGNRAKVRAYRERRGRAGARP